MTSAIFFDWLVAFDQYVSKTKDRKVALPLDNCSAHGRVDTIPILYHTKIIFLPPNTSSKIQPMDAGIDMT